MESDAHLFLTPSTTESVGRKIGVSIKAVHIDYE